MRAALAALAAGAALAAAAPAGAAPASGPRLAAGVLSDERTVTRWAHADVAALARARPSDGARPVARLRYYTEDGYPDVYLLLRRRIDAVGREWIRVRIARLHSPAQPRHPLAGPRPAAADRHAAADHLARPQPVKLGPAARAGRTRTRAVAALSRRRGSTVSVRTTTMLG